MIELRGVRYGYPGADPLLDHVSLSLGPGLSLLVGPNGSGKSSLLRLVAGIERPEAGTVRVHGTDLWREEVSARRHLAYLPDVPDVTPYAGVLELLQFVCRLRGEPPARAQERLEEVGLGGYGDRPVQLMSLGQQRRAMLAAAWIGDPRCLVLDEPLDAMDRRIRGRIIEWIAGVVDRGGAALVATHELEPFIPQVRRVVRVERPAVRVIELEAVEDKRSLLEELAG